MGIRNVIVSGKIYFLTMTIVGWVDVFTKPVYKHLIVDSLNYCVDQKNLVVYGWCLMTNHLHMIASASEEQLLSDIIRDFKKYTSKAITNALIDHPESRRDWMLHQFSFAGKYDKKIKYYKVWQDGNEAKEIQTNEFLLEKLNYIHNNPVKAEIVGQPEDFLFSSARDYAGEKGLVKIQLI